MGWDVLVRVMWFTLRGVSHILGSLSILALYASFSAPHLGALAFVMLIGASMIALGLPAEPQSTGRRRS